MGSPKVTLYFDIVSPFGRIAYHVLRTSAAFKKCDVAYVPILLGGLFKLCNNTAPIIVKNKGKWIDEERLRWQKYYEVPMSQGTPPGFPPNTITCLRALCTIEKTQPDKLPRAIDALYDALWTRHEEISNPEVVFSVLSKALGEADAKAAMKGAQADGKKILAENTDKAFASGAFGVPWFVCSVEGKEDFGVWGVDRIPLMLEYLGLEMPQGSRALL